MIHRKKLLASALLLGVGVASQAVHASPILPPFNECPAVGAAGSCSILFEFTTGGGINTYVDNSVGAYDSSDDTLVGVINNSSSIVNSLSLTGAGNGGGIFDFESDGIQSYGVDVSGTVFPTGYSITGYEGPNTYFSNITTTSIFDDTGTVNFIGGLAPGASLYFSLESSPDSIQQGGGITPTNPVPEPGTLALYGLGLSALSLMTRRRKSKA